MPYKDVFNYNFNKMKRLIFYLFLVLFSNSIARALQVDFIQNSAEGFPFHYYISDNINKKVWIVRDPNVTIEVGVNSAPFVNYNNIVVPKSVSHNGIKYDVEKVCEYTFYHVAMESLSFPDNISLGENFISDVNINKLYLPKNLSVLQSNLFNQMSRSGNPGGITGINELHINEGLKKIKMFGTWGEGYPKRIIGFATSNIEELESRAFMTYRFYSGTIDPALLNDLSVLPQTMRILRTSCFDFMPGQSGGLPLDKIIIPLSIESIESDVYDISNDVYISHQLPFQLDANSFGHQTTLKIHVPLDRSFAFKPSLGWSSYTDNIVEDLKIGSTGFTTYYLNNENFLVPAGCTAYIITGVTPSGNQALPDQAIVKAFGAGKIIPKQTGFVLQGPANSTVTYQANVTGAEEDVTGNLLVGTATGEEFSTTGKRYYVLAAGSQGMGFYKQGVREGKSINLPAHRAGLCLDASIARAKGLIIDFDAAREATGISSVNSDVQKKEDVIYDLQGRRVAHPSHGIYIINGKKVVK